MFKFKPTHNVQIPVEVLLNNNLDATSVRVFAYIKLRYQFFNSLNKDMTESVKTMCETLNLSRSTFQRSIRKLQQEGLLQIIPKPPLTNAYVITDCLTNNKGNSIGHT